MNFDFETPLTLDGPIQVGRHEISVQSAEPAPCEHGYRLWSGALVLADQVDGFACAGMTICELGAGLGLPGIVAALRGAKVTLVERNVDVCRLARQNARRNKTKVKVVAADWTHHRGRYDSLIGSEIFYPHYRPSQLPNVISRCWTGRGPCVFTNMRPEEVERVAADLGVSPQQFSGQHPQAGKFMAYGIVLPPRVTGQSDDAATVNGDHRLASKMRTIIDGIRNFSWFR